MKVIKERQRVNTSNICKGSNCFDLYPSTVLIFILLLLVFYHIPFSSTFSFTYFLPLSFFNFHSIFLFFFIKFTILGVKDTNMENILGIGEHLFLHCSDGNCYHHRTPFPLTRSVPVILSLNTCSSNLHTYVYLYFLVLFSPLDNL